MRTNDTQKNSSRFSSKNLQGRISGEAISSSIFQLSISVVFIFLFGINASAVDFTMSNSTNTIDCTVANNFFDTGGAGGNYGNSESFEMTFAPGAAGHYISLDFSSFNIELNADYLYIYDGASSADPLIGVYTGTTSPGLVSATGVSGSLTVTFASNGSGIASGWEAAVNQTVDVPLISCPGDESHTCPITLADYTSLVTLTNGNSCLSESNLVYSQCPAAGTLINDDTQVVINVTDPAGNNSSCSFDITIDDSTAPTITCIGDQSVTLDGNCEYVVPDYVGSMTVTDNCTASPTVYQFPAAGTVLTTDATVNIYALDASNNMSTCSFQMITSGGSCTPTGGCSSVLGDYSGLATITDAMDPNPTILQLPPAGTVVYSDTQILIFATDDANNSSQCSFMATANDNIDPIISCPADQNVAFDVACEFILLDYSSLITASDNCDGQLSITQSPVVGTSIAGTTTITMTATDDAGNSAFCTFDIIPTDDVDPTIVCAADVTVSADAGLCTASGVSLGSPTTADNCSVASTTSDAPAIFPLGTTTVTWTVTDGSGNTATCTQTVTVNDTEDPTIACAADVTVSADAGLCTASGVSLGSLTTADNCSVASTTSDAPAIFPLGTTTVTWTVTDGSGNTATCTQTVTVNDTEDPTIACAADVTVSADAGICTASGVSLGSPTTADNCSVASTTSDAPAIFPLGTTTVTWTVTDGSGNTATCTQTVTVNDTEDPTIVCAADVTVSADAGICTASGVSLGSPTTADNCSVASSTSDAPAIFPLGTTTVTWTVTDGSGNTATCTQTVTVNDTEDPTITCPSDVSQTADAGVCEANLTIAAAITADNCGVASVVNDYNNTADASDIYPVGTTTIIWTVTDNSGNAVTCTQIITISDDEDPTITCPSDVAQTADSGVCEANVSIAALATGDNCSVASVINDYNNTSDASDIYPVGTTTVVWTVTDAAGNTATCSMDIVISDNENPSITCPADVNQTADAGVCEANLTIAAAVTADNCGVASVTNDYNNTSDASDIYPVGTTSVVWTVTDIYGNTSTCTQTVTITDDENPSITCPGDQNVSADINCEFTMADYSTMAITADNCTALPTVTQSPLAGTVVSGTTVVTLTSTDDAGNTNSCTFTVIVADNTDPIITVCASDVTEQVDANCEFALSDYTTLATATDNCDTDVSFTQSPIAGTIISGNATVQTVTITATDDNGNFTTCTFDVTLEDSINPTITCPADVAQGVDLGVCEAAVTIAAPITADNCSVLSVVNDYNNSSDASDTYPVGTTSVVWTVTDINGNAANCTQTIVISDDEDPTITCPADVNQTADAGVCEANITIAAAVNADNCGVASVINDYNNTSDASDIYPVGTTSVVWTVTDIYGNTSTCTQTITITDDEDPTISCPADVIVSADGGVCTASGVSLGSATTSDNCSVASTTNDAPATYSLGTTTVTWTVTDASGNTATCTQTVTVNDTENPTIACPSDVTVSADGGSCTASGVAIGSPTTNDNCSVASVTSDAPVEFQIGITTVTWTVIDGSGNTATCTQTVTVNDTENPTITCPADITLNEYGGACDAFNSGSIGSPEISDNCTIASITNDAPATFPVGTTTVTWTVTDGSGNTATCTQDITVLELDDEAPVIVCPPNVNLDLGN